MFRIPQFFDGSIPRVGIRFPCSWPFALFLFSFSLFPQTYHSCGSHASRQRRRHRDAGQRQRQTGAKRVQVASNQRANELAQHPRARDGDGGLLTVVEYDVSPGHQPLRRACTIRHT